MNNSNFEISEHTTQERKTFPDTSNFEWSFLKKQQVWSKTPSNLRSFTLLHSEEENDEEEVGFTRNLYTIVGAIAFLAIFLSGGPLHQS